jgi:hypothetical protein
MRGWPELLFEWNTNSPRILGLIRMPHSDGHIAPESFPFAMRRTAPGAHQTPILTCALNPSQQESRFQESHHPTELGWPARVVGVQALVWSRQIASHAMPHCSAVGGRTPEFSFPVCPILPIFSDGGLALSRARVLDLSSAQPRDDEIQGLGPAPSGRLGVVMTTSILHPYHFPLVMRQRRRGKICVHEKETRVMQRLYQQYCTSLPQCASTDAVNVAQ